MTRDSSAFKRRWMSIKEGYSIGPQLLEVFLKLGDDLRIFNSNYTDSVFIRYWMQNINRRLYIIHDIKRKRNFRNRSDSYVCRLTFN
ncbi:hypothetical protein A6E15_18060 [Natrinema saccharevitans]|uniref:Uncharacterized protein n=1 Tax=Natrinema saccharevitans TaxID=301967 RepID=A0A1S8ARK4_9EURY|nr:hypothetical protein A6E15_18060 [Natrinema saccharevitans]